MNFQTFRSLGLLVVLIPFLASCGKPVVLSTVPSDPNNPGTPTNRAALDGTWTGPCITSAQLDNVPATETLSVSGTTFTDTFQIYSDAGCSQKLFAIAVLATISGDATDGTLDLQLTGMMVTPSTDSVAAKWNSTQYSGFSNWSTGSSNDVAKSQGFTDGEMLYGSYSIQGATLSHSASYGYTEATRAEFFEGWSLTKGK
jgi:hypothetical protein